MAKVIYNGPADTVELDGIVVERGKARIVTNDQLARLRVSDPRAAVEVVDAGTQDELDELRIRAEQDAERDELAAKRIKDERDRERERERIATESTKRAEKAAKEREELRSSAGRPTTRGGKD